MLHKLKVELFNGWTNFEKFYILSILLMQFIVFYFNPDNIITGIAAISGILGVTLLAKGKISTYFFGVIQSLSYIYVTYHAHLPGEVLLNIFYFSTQFIGFYNFRKNLHSVSDSETKVVDTKKMAPKQILFAGIGLVIAWAVIGYLLGFLGSVAPYFDSIAVSLSVTAQILTIRRFRESWLVWICVNVVTLALWLHVGNISMFVMYIGFLINSLVGMYNWTQLEKATLKPLGLTEE